MTGLTVRVKEEEEEEEETEMGMLAAECGSPERPGSSALGLLKRTFNHVAQGITQYHSIQLRTVQVSQTQTTRTGHTKPPEA